MSKLIVLQGCPCSGKSTWSKEYIKNNENTIRVCRDDIRLELNNGKYSMDNEREVSIYEKERIIAGIHSNLDVIIDATNLNPKTIKQWNDLANDLECDIEFKKFYIPFSEAMVRSKKRKEEGGLYISKKVMLGFYKRYFPNELSDEFTDKRIIKEPELKLPNCVICDLDGTLALHQGRHPYEWDKISTDKMDSRLQLMLMKLHANNQSEIIFVTGRNAEARQATIEWLDKHLGIKDYKLYTKEPNEYTSGEVYKERIYHEYIENKYNVLCVFEDSDRCVLMWRKLGLLTCQLENNDY
jgi:predicted kinase